MAMHSIAIGHSRTYRPISLTCIASKLMEHILVSNIMKHAQSHNILYDLQHGFRSRVSCETQLIQFTNDLVTNMQSGAQTDVIVMDFSKAFDKVSHTKLVDKLHHYMASKAKQIPGLKHS